MQDIRSLESYCKLTNDIQEPMKLFRLLLPMCFRLRIDGTTKLNIALQNYSGNDLKVKQTNLITQITQIVFIKTPGQNLSLLNHIWTRVEQLFTATDITVISVNTKAGIHKVAENYKDKLKVCLTLIKTCCGLSTL